MSYAASQRAFDDYISWKCYKISDVDKEIGDYFFNRRNQVKNATKDINESAFKSKTPLWDERCV